MGDKLIEIINNVEDIKSTVDGSIHTSLQDTTTNLINAKNDLVDNLEAKGITGLTGDETLTELVPEVLNIQSINEYFNTEIDDVSTQSQNEWWRKDLIKKIPDIYIDDSITNLTKLFYSYPLTVVPKVISGSNITSLWKTYSNMYVVTQVDLSGIDTSNVTTMSNLFESSSNLTSLDLSNFDTKKVTAMNAMFGACTHLTSLDLSMFETPVLVDTSTMFQNCTLLTRIDMRKFDFSSVTTYYTNMFGATASTGVPDNCLIIVADQTQKDWINTKFSRLTNVQTVAEYEASLGGGE